MDSAVRFCGLYLTTLFSFDTYSAAANSPYRQASSKPLPPRTTRTDFGEGNKTGFRLDPGGRGSRKGGFEGKGKDVFIPTCGRCADPKIS
jgi:hypothetical protein